MNYSEMVVSNTMKYEAMKDSRLPWIRNIPSHWNVTRIKEFMQNVSEKNHPNATVLSLYREYGILPKASRNDNHNVTSLDTASYKLVHRGELVINKMKAWQGSLGVSDYEGIISPAYYVCRFMSDKIVKKYIHYLLRSKSYAQEFERLSTGMRVGQWDLGIDDFMSTPALIPPPNEQSAIAEYLDNQCAKIDTLIDEAKSSIEEYKKWKASLIFEAVTKGLDPNVEMKDSGVKWLSKVPKKFNIKPLKQIVVNRNGGVWGNNPNGTENDRICMRIADFSFDSGRFKEMPLSMYTLRNYTASQIDKFTLQRGDICIEKSGGGEKTPVGRAVLFDLPLKALYANFMESISVDSNIIMPEFVEYFWRGMYYKSVPTAYIKQTTGIQNLNISSLLEKEYILIPDKEEQKSIVEYLDSICATIDNLIDIKFKLIEDIKLYKQSIIFETVTGKRKVV